MSFSFKMARGSNALDPSGQGWKSALVGPVFDDRGTLTTSVLGTASVETHALVYDPVTGELDFDSDRISRTELNDVVASLKQPLVLDTTTLCFVELLLVTEALIDLRRPSVAYLYLEPKNYTTPSVTEVLRRRDFELTDEVKNFVGVDGYSPLLSETGNHVVAAILGYEGARLDSALELPITSNSCHVIFGIPAFRPGWEMDAFHNNHQALKAHGLGTRIRYAGATDPRAHYEALLDLYRRKHSTADFIVAPIGPKPMGIGAALFLLATRQEEDTFLLYDHPRRAFGRSREVGPWH